MSDRILQTEIAVVGAGPAGVAAACAAAESGRRVTLIDDTPWLGGQIWRGEQSHPKNRTAQEWLNRLANSNSTVFAQCTALFSPRPGVLHVDSPEGPLQLSWDKLILATGARELFLPFPGWTLPGVLGPGGLQALVKNGWPVAGKRVVVAGSGPLLLAVADGLRSYGAKVVCIAEQAPGSRIQGFAAQLVRFPSKLMAGAALKLRLLGVSYLTGCWPVSAKGSERMDSVTLTDGRHEWPVPCDLLACGFGLVPNIELPLALGCRLRGNFVAVDEFQRTSVENVFCAGEPTGIGGADCALAEGLIAGYAATGSRGKAEDLVPARNRWHRFRTALIAAFALRSELKTLARQDTILCRCEDVPYGRVREFQSWREAKLQTRCGMGPCQGRICGSATKFIFGWGMESVRPPIYPALIQNLTTPKPSVNSRQTRERTANEMAGCHSGNDDGLHTKPGS